MIRDRPPLITKSLPETITHLPPKTYDVPEKTVLSLISRHLLYLSVRLQDIDYRMKLMKRRHLTYLDIQLFRSRPCIRNQIEVLKKLYEKFSSDSTVRHHEPSFIAQLFRELDQKLLLISEGEKNLGLGRPLSESQNNYLSIKSRVIHQSDMIQKIFNEIFENRGLVESEVPLLSEFCHATVFDTSDMIKLNERNPEETFEDWADKWSIDCPLRCPVTSKEVLFLQGYEEGYPVKSKEYSAGNLARESAEGGCRSTIRNLNCSHSLKEISEHEFIASQKQAIGTKRWLFPEGMEVSMPTCSHSLKEISEHECIASKKQAISTKSWLFPEGMEVSMPQLETTKKTLFYEVSPKSYLCLNTGYEILYLDLEKNKAYSFNCPEDVPFCPRIATVDLAEQNLPNLVSIFKWKSNVFLIGGTNKPLNSKCRPEGTSCVTYALSLADSAGSFFLPEKCSVSHSKSDIFQLEKPKIWPIVEEINGQIHVIESAPEGFQRSYLGWPFSHAVFDSDSGSLDKEIPTISEEGGQYKIGYYSVLGDRIFASACGYANLVFDSNKREWEAYKARYYGRRMKKIWCLIDHGPGKCVGTFPYGGSDPLYVVISLQHSCGEGCHLKGLDALACLVDSTTGMLVCIQHLYDFFKGPLWPCTMSNATIIQADDEGKTLCSIVNGSTWDEVGDPDYLFINKFQVEILSEAAPMVSSCVREVLAKGSEAWPKEVEFVRVETKDSYTCKLDMELGWGTQPNSWAGLQACFV